MDTITPSFFDRPGVENSLVTAGDTAIPLGIERVSNAALGIGGAYGSWGQVYDNAALPAFVEHRTGLPLVDSERMNLAELGFNYRHHLPDLADADHLELELTVGARLLTAALQANGWQPQEVDGLLIGMSGPASTDYLPRLAERAGLRRDVLKVSLHKACDGSMGALHLALNPRLSAPGAANVAEQLRGKKVLVGGIEGLSRFTSRARDKNALQLFGNGMGAIGVIPGETMQFLAGRSFENFDEEGLLQVRMYYPHSRQALLETTQESHDHLRVAGLMHEPADGTPVVMAGLMGMVKLFVRSGVQVVVEVMKDYTAYLEKTGQAGRAIKVGIVHHANYKINQLKAKQLQKEGVSFPMPWLLSEFGNVSAASNMIAFLRQLPHISAGDHILLDGFGAGTYYDVMAVQVG
ncbi:MAG: 3-oxoacyl-[acyl-carrier-protein] synthase III C-terminal domain-containing protein [Chloroflexota bacterium]